MDRLDGQLLGILIRDGRTSYADLGRHLDISRAHARERVQRLVDQGIIEQFSVIINPDKLDIAYSTFIDLRVNVQYIESLAAELADCQEVVSLYIMNDLQSLHIHTLTRDSEDFLRFAKSHIFSRPEIISVECKNLLRRIKNRRGGVRL